MNKIKMSDEFGEGISIPDSWNDKSNYPQLELNGRAAVYGIQAINSYDDNQSEIAALKEQVASLTLKNAGLNSRLTNSVDLRNAVVVENNEMKAQVELFRKSLDFINNLTLEFSSKKQFNELYGWGVSSSGLLNKTPRQCLADSDAAAVKKYVDSFDGNSETKVYLSWVKKDGAAYANKIREAANGEN